MRETPIQNWEYKPEQVEVTIPEEEVVELFSGNKFLECLELSGQETRKTGHETGFRIFIDENKKIDFGHVIKGSSHSINTREEDFKVLKGGIDRPESEERTTTALNFHFHPETDQVIIPSADDLSVLQGLWISEMDKGGDTKRVGVHNMDILQGICAIHDKGNIDMLLIRVKKGVPNSEVDENAQQFDTVIDEELQFSADYARNTKNQARVQKVLEQCGFDSCFVSYNYNKKTGKYSISKEQKQKIKNFGNIKFNLEITKI